MKAFTDIEQSKKLAEILPIESADMFWADGERPAVWNNKDISLDEMDTPAWSLTALLALLQLPTLEEIPITDTETKWQCTIYCDKAKYWSELHDEPIDACVEMIIELNK